MVSLLDDVVRSIFVEVGVKELKRKLHTQNTCNSDHAVLDAPDTRQPLFSAQNLCLLFGDVCAVRLLL